ncbi:MAG: PAS domain S-box protein [Cytophagales bacterium]|nr:PAS domain S-box protein [Cytophagales bacterium]
MKSFRNLSQSGKVASLLAVSTVFALVSSLLACVLPNKQWGWTLVVMLNTSLVMALYVAMRYYSLHPLKTLVSAVRELAKGNTQAEVDYQAADELGELARAITQIKESLKNSTTFISKIGEGNFEARLENTFSGDEGARDSYSQALLTMRDRLKSLSEEQEKRKWVTEGIAHFADILRQSDLSFKEWADKIIASLVKMLKANQGGLFILNQEDEGDAHLEMVATYAYNKKKHVQKRVEIGQGLVGQCVLEKDIIYMTDIPQGYVHITSGLGEALPTNILIAPLMINEQVYGVVELASFQILQKHEIEFVQKLGENIASAISTAKINERTTRLLRESQMQAEEMRAQEEEMRQNMEELEATQEEMGRKTIELEGMTTAVDNSLIKAELDGLGKILAANHNFCDTLGLPEESVIGRHLKELMTPDERAAFDRIWAQVLSGGSRFGNMQLSARGGQTRHLAASQTAILDSSGDVRKVLFLGQDITSSKQLEQQATEQSEELRAQQEELQQQMEEMQAVQDELAQRESQLKMIFDASPNAMVISSLVNSSIRLCNSKVGELVGVKPEELLGKPTPDFYHKPDDRVRMLNEFKQKGELQGYEIELKRSNGSLFWASMYMKPIVFNGETCLMASIVDISEKKLYDLKLREKTIQYQDQIDDLRAQTDLLSLQLKRAQAKLGQDRTLQLDEPLDDSQRRKSA